MIGRAAICRDVQTLAATCAYGENAPNRVFQVWNCGLPGTTLSYTLTPSAPWLSCDPASGSSTGPPADPITVHFDTAGLPAGQYFATVTISDPNAAYSPRTVGVALAVTCPGAGWLPWDMNY